MKTKLERAIDDTRYILECLEKLREITRKSCKSCENWGCEWEDKELRYNCPHYRGEEE